MLGVRAHPKRHSRGRCPPAEASRPLNEKASYTLPAGVGLHPASGSSTSGSSVHSIHNWTPPISTGGSHAPKASIRVSRATRSGLGRVSPRRLRAPGPRMLPRAGTTGRDDGSGGCATPTTNEPHKQDATRWLDRAGDQYPAQCRGMLAVSGEGRDTHAPRAILTDPMGAGPDGPRETRHATWHAGICQPPTAAPAKAARQTQRQPARACSPGCSASPRNTCVG